MHEETWFRETLYFETLVTIAKVNRGHYGIQMSGCFYVSKNICRDQISTRHASSGWGFKSGFNPTAFLLLCSELRLHQTYVVVM